MIDAVVKILIGIGVRDAGQMDHGIAPLEQRRPVEGRREVRKRSSADVRPEREVAITLKPCEAR
jgi:hypothetical protein